jgi:hypothetical protein
MKGECQILSHCRKYMKMCNRPNIEKYKITYLLYIQGSEWLLFSVNSAMFQLYHVENKFIFNPMMMRSALYKTNTLSWIFKVLSHWNNSPSCPPTRTHYSNSEPTSLCSFSLMLGAQRRSNTYQFYSLWFDPIGARTHDLPHSRRTC